MLLQFRGYASQIDGSIITWLTFRTFKYKKPTKATFQSLGTIPLDKKLLKILISMGPIMM